MDIFIVFVLHFVIQLLSKGHADDLVSSLLGSVTNIRCSSPPLWFNRTGYIQCQKTCISYPGCNVVRYSRSHLECYIYINGSCSTYSGDSDSNIYIWREDIDDSIGKSCRHTECQTTDMCIVMTIGAKCLPDTVFSPYVGRATSVEVDGVYFWAYPAFKTHAAARQICESSNGRLAVLNTSRKMELVTTDLQKHQPEYFVWFVAVNMNDNGEWLWSTGEHVGIINIDNDGKCAVINRGGFVYDHNCESAEPFVCEML